MIRIAKSPKAPAKLTGDGAKKRRANSVSYTRNPAAYDAGDMTFAFDRDIYAHGTVKEALKNAQHGKCAFCESRTDDTAYGDVEHYRPKGGFKQRESDHLGRPGYYWLAYEWTNLFFACQLCNQRFKKNLFPLAEPLARARNHKDDLAQEAPMLVDPGSDDPSEHIGFAHEVVFARTVRGRRTIEILGLDRPELDEHRMTVLRPFVVLKEMLEAEPDAPEADKIRTLFERARHPTQPFSAMINDLLNG